jgi:tRNA threonylcarbamoyladenosine biosynthesis protein TsaB
MNILAIETSGATCGASVFHIAEREQRMLSVAESCVGNVHDELLATTIEDALRLARISLSDISTIALSAGPGSFTGLRIGAAFAKGLCFQTNTRFLAIPTADALAAASAPVAMHSEVQRIVVVIPSHRDLFYVGIYATDATRNVELTLIPRTHLIEALTVTDLVVGPSAEQFSSVSRTVSGLNRLSARFIGFTACQMILQGAPFSDAATFEPQYHQRFPAPR